MTESELISQMVADLEENGGCMEFGQMRLFPKTGEHRKETVGEFVFRAVAAAEVLWPNTWQEHVGVRS